MRVYSVLFLLTFWFSANSQGISFYKGEWKEALEEAKKTDKLLFVDAYAKWCGPCKRMSKNVFTQAEVGEFFNENFINLKLDMEDTDGLTFGRLYPVRAYPTLFFLDGDGNIVKKVTGGQQAEGLISIGKTAIGSYDKSGQYAEQYEEGNREFDLVLNYVKELNKVGKPSLKISNEYLISNPEITTSQKAEFLLTAVVDSDSKIFSTLIENKKAALTIVSESEFEDVVNTACQKTVDKAVEYEYEDLLNEAIESYKSAEVGDASKFEQEAKLNYYKQTGMYDNWESLSKKYLKKYGKKDVEPYEVHMTDIQKNFSYKKEASEYQNELMETIIKIDDQTSNYMLYIKMLMNKKQSSKALEVAKEAMKKAKKRKEDTKAIEKIITYLSGDNMD